jgi:sec-independent protein translocase protein TatA
MNLFVIAGMLGPNEIIIILVVVLLLFGGRKIPELMKGLGQGMKEFKKASQADDQPDNEKPAGKIEK